MLLYLHEVKTGKFFVILLPQIIKLLQKLTTIVKNAILRFLCFCVLIFTPACNTHRAIKLILFI